MKQKKNSLEAKNNGKERSESSGKGDCSRYDPFPIYRIAQERIQCRCTDRRNIVVQRIGYLISD